MDRKIWTFHRILHGILRPNLAADFTAIPPPTLWVRKKYGVHLIDMYNLSRLAWELVKEEGVRCDRCTWAHLFFDLMI